MKKFFTVLNITFLVLIVIYLLAIPVFSKKIEIKENVVFTPTKYIEDSILKLPERILLTNNETS